MITLRIAVLPPRDEALEGDKKETTIVAQVRVNTHAASHVYHYSWVRDCGGDAYEHWPATLLAKVEFGKKWVFGDDYTRQHFACTSSASCVTTGATGTTTTTKSLRSPSSAERLLVEMYPGAKPALASTGWYWAANLLLLTWPYRVWLDAICQRLIARTGTTVAGDRGGTATGYEYRRPPAPIVHTHHHHHHTVAPSSCTTTIITRAPIKAAARHRGDCATDSCSPT